MGAKKKASAAAAKSTTRKHFVLSKTMRAKLPLAERENAEDALLQKSAGVCALCGEPITGSSDIIVADHKIPEAADGVTNIDNLYLAHKSCNSSRQDLPIDIARKIITFRAFAESRHGLTFDHVLDRYVPNSGRAIKVSLLDNVAEISFNAGHSVRVPVGRDPATGVRYFFLDVPVECIQNDKEIQPRKIMHAHVRRLALDFIERPVHEPSSARLLGQAGDTAVLRQFDGQHKTTAQIILGRSAVPMKIYIEPQQSMLQELVLKVQQEIKKQPLTKSETLAKMGDVIMRHLETYKEPGGAIRTEKGFILSQPKQEQKEIREMYFRELQRLVFFDVDNKLAKHAGPGRNPTDKIVIDKIIRPLIYPDALELDLDSEGGRDNEREAIVTIMNTIASEMLPEGWEKNELQKRRATTFFYQGSIGWWMGDLLIGALRYFFMKIGDKKPLLIDKLSQEKEDQLVAVTEHICGLPIWSDPPEEALRAMRSNTIDSVRRALPEYTQERIIKEVDSES